MTKRFKMLFTQGDESYGLQAISIVNDPAMESLHLLLSKEQQLKLSVEDTKKGVITGALMIPDKVILRKDKESGEHYEVVFPAETIELASRDFMKNFRGANINVEHSVDVDDVYLSELWIVDDPENDKSKALGIEVPKGTLMVSLKVDNKELREELLETGLLKGLSLEGKFTPELVEEVVEASKIKTEINTEIMNTNDTKEKGLIHTLKVLLGIEPTEVKLESAVAEVNKWWSDVTNDTFELGTQVMRKPYEDGGEPNPIGAGDWELEDGTRFLTDNEGIIRYIFETVADTTSTDNTPAEVKAEEAPADTEVVEASKVKPETIKEVKEVLETEEKVELIAHTDIKKESTKEKLKFNHKLTVQERIQAQLNVNLSGKL